MGSQRPGERSQAEKPMPARAPRWEELGKPTERLGGLCGWSALSDGRGEVGARSAAALKAPVSRVDFSSKPHKSFKLG